ncbi:MAG: hypothetical protein WCN88_04985 [Candidatus Falkowbacteria bacterium]
MSIKKERFQTKPPKYNPSMHIPLIDEIFGSGKSIAAFCVAAKIVRSTFFNWVNSYPEFEEAYELATLKAEVYWEEYAQTNAMLPGFNYSWWGAKMRNCFGWTEHRKLKIKDIDTAQTANDKYNLVLKAVAQGELTGHELKQVSETILTGAKINEATSIVQEVEELVQRVKQMRG